MPANLCPPDNGNGQNYPATTAKEGAWRVAAYIQPEDRPRVTEGDFIGRAGNSGNSSGPHLHMSLSPVTGTDSKGREALDRPKQCGFATPGDTALKLDSSTHPMADTGCAAANSRETRIARPGRRIPLIAVSRQCIPRLIYAARMSKPAPLKAAIRCLSPETAR
ncbi:MAG: M23 family metallopeptidase [Nitrosomonas sp.]|nr:M23 family metallopeptidase [Nitrosomonas sp.]